MSPKLKLEASLDGTGSSWITLTSWSGKDYLLLSKGISISRGRDDETGDAVSPGTMTLVLDNTDARFSPGMTGSPCYPYLEKPGTLLKLSAWVNGAWVARFYGVAQSWITTLDGDLTGKRAITTVTAVDMLGAFPRYTFRQAADEVPRSMSTVLYHLPMRGDMSPLIGSQIPIDNGNNSDGGSLLPLDEGTDSHPLFKSASGGRTLTIHALSTPASWSVSFVLMAQPTATCTLLKINDLVQVNWAADGLRLAGFTGAPATGITPYGFPCVVTVANNAGAGGWVAAFMSPDDDGVYSDTGTSSAWGPVRKIVINPTLSGGAQWCAGHLTICDDTNGLLTQILAARAYEANDGDDSAITFMCQLAHITPAVRPAGLAGTVLIPALEGRDAADAIAALVTGMGARLVGNPDGTLKWVPFAPSTTPVTVPKVTSDLSWGTSEIGWRSDTTVTRYDGSTYTATRTDGKRQTADIEGVHATSGQDRSLADWLTNSAGMDGRCPQVSTDVLALTAAQQQDVCGVGPGSRISGAMPSYMPAGLVLICEGLDESISAQAWTITFKASPDTYSRIGVYDSGQTWDSGMLWGP